MKLGKNVVIDPEASVDESVEIGDNSVIVGKSKIGKNVVIGHNSVIGFPHKKNLKEKGIGKSDGCVINEGCLIRSNVVIYEGVVLEKEVETGHNVMIRENSCIGKGSKIGSYVSIEWDNVIGEGCVFQGHSMTSEGSRIGNNVFLGPFFNSTGDNSMGRVEGEYKPNPAVIEDNVRIGSSVVLLPGIKLGKDSVIGAGSVVTKDVKEGKVVIGVPAREK